jgi:hypothetical protein
MRIGLSFFSHYAIPLFRESVIPSFISKKKILTIASLAFICLATCYAIWRRCFKATQMIEYPLLNSLNGQQKKFAYRSIVKGLFDNGAFIFWGAEINVPGKENEDEIKDVATVPHDEVLLDEEEVESTIIENRILPLALPENDHPQVNLEEATQLRSKFALEDQIESAEEKDLGEERDLVEDWEFIVESHQGDDGFVDDRKLVDKVNIDELKAQVFDFQKESLNDEFDEVGKEKKVSLDGTIDIGKFEGGNLQGKGKRIYLDKTLEIGKFIDGFLHGQGKRLNADGTVEEGVFQRSLLHGTGKFTDVDGEILEGNFEFGAPVGKGRRVYPDKTIEEGVFRRGLLQGPGRKIYPDGREEGGFFKNDCFSSASF